MTIIIRYDILHIFVHLRSNKEKKIENLPCFSFTALQFYEGTVSKLGKILFENIIILSFELLFLTLSFENTDNINLLKILTISNDIIINY